MAPAGSEAGGGVDVQRSSSANLRDLLRIRQDDYDVNVNSNDSSSSSSLNTNNRPTLGSVLSLNQRTMYNRSLVDDIRDEQQDGGGGGHHRDPRKSWRQLREKLKLRRAGSGSNWTSSVPVPASDMPLNPNSNRYMARRHPGLSSNSGSFGQDREGGSPRYRSRSSLHQSNGSRAVDRGSSGLDNSNDEEGVEEGQGESPDGGAPGGGGGEGGGEPVRMSLMALLAETDREMGLDGATYMMDGDDLEEDDDDEEEVVEKDEYNSCCVCMVRHKGAAFIPCGHTFCRLCSRELYVQRGNCPLCNNFILEILDIF